LVDIKRKIIMLPGPVDVPDDVLLAMSKPIINHRGADFHELMASIENNARAVFQTKNNVVILSSSGTGGAESAVFNIIRPGDKAIVPVFGEFSGRLAEQIEQAGGRAVRVNAPFGTAPSIDQIEAAIKLNGDAKSIFLVYNDTSPGTTYRMAQELGELAVKYGLFYIADSISVLGGDELPQDKWNMDIVIAGSQKALFTPPGLALIGVSDKVIDYVKKNKPYSTYFDYSKYVDYLSKLETPFTPALPLFYALDIALGRIVQDGIDKRIQMHRTGAQAYYDAFKEMGLEPFVEEKLRSNVVISIKYPTGIDDAKFRSIMESDYNMVIAGGFGEVKGKIFRIGNMGIISKSKILPTIAAVGHSLNSLGYKNDVSRAIDRAKEILTTLTQ